ncbi:MULTISPECIES: APC family permease [unclassified Streptomyces]|uniref:APC family permease n=1 Tax=unclassified Streptomyces TaxID=2593676 RepID=UPI00278BE5BB|nr:MULTISPECIES: APC family permease [unclassified Streptomyces]
MSSEPPGLRRSLGVVDGIAIAASSTAATTSIGIGMGSLAATVGLQAPAVLLVAFVPILGIAAAYARLNRQEPNMGNGYVWVGRSLGPWLGFLTGWVTLVGTLVFMAYTSAVTGSVFLQFANKAQLHSLLGLDLDPNSTALSTVVGLVVLTAVTVTAVTGVRKATRLQAWLLVFEYVVLLGFCGWSLVTGSHAFQWSWLNPFDIHSGTAFAQGLVLAVFFYWGWDAAFTVTEETKDVRDAGRGGFIALFAMLGLFLYGSVAFQREMSLPELVEQGPQALTYLGAKLADEPVASLPLLALLFSAVASLQASVIPTARGLLAMGRDRTMGPLWTRVSPRYGSPAAGTVVVMSIAAVVALLALAIPKLNEMILAAVNSIGLTVALYYGLTALACAVRFRALLRTAPRASVPAVVVPGLSGLALLGIGAYLAYSYATMNDHFELSPDNGWFMLAVPAAIVVSGLVMAGVAKYGRRSPYFTTGRGTDADSVELAGPKATT